VQLSTQGTLIQRFDILKNVFKAMPMRVDLMLGQGVEHERVIGIRRMA
jgi:hypothetical protein